jgi:biotin carboxyl carrier protein
VTIKMMHRIDAPIGGHVAELAARAGARMALDTLPARIEFESTPAEPKTGVGR